MEEKIMTGEREKTEFDYIAGALSAVLVIMNVISYYNWENVVNIILWVAIAVGMFIKKGDLLVGAGVGGMVVKAIIVSIYYHIGGIANILGIVVMILTFICIAAMCIPSFKNFVNVAEQYWLKIGIVHLLLGFYSILMYVVNMVKYDYYYINWGILLYILSTIINGAVFFMLLLAKCKPKNNYNDINITDNTQTILEDDE